MIRVFSPFTLIIKVIIRFEKSQISPQLSAKLTRVREIEISVEYVLETTSFSLLLVICRTHCIINASICAPYATPLHNYITFLTSYLSALPAEDELTILDGTINRQCASVSKVAARLNNPVILARPRFPNSARSR